eukprot:scpid95725/ scgid29181/ 
MSPTSTPLPVDSPETVRGELVTVCSQRSKWRCPVSLWLLKYVPASRFNRDCPQPTGEQCAASAASGGVQFRCGCSKTCIDALAKIAVFQCTVELRSVGNISEGPHRDGHVGSISMRPGTTACRARRKRNRYFATALL